MLHALLTIIFLLCNGIDGTRATTCEEFFRSQPKNILKSLIGKTFQGGQFTLGVCTGADPSLSDAGVVERNGAGESIVLGRLSSFSAVAGKGWVQLTYGNGSGSQCPSGQPSSASVMLVCSERGESFGLVHRVACSASFELLHPLLCGLRHDAAYSGSLSPGTVVLILLLSAACAYLLCGMLLQRFAFNKRGAEQIPNYAFWRRCGNAAADGCDFVCRSEPRDERQYRPLGGQPPATRLVDEDDENLLPA